MQSKQTQPKKNPKINVVNKDNTLFVDEVKYFEKTLQKKNIPRTVNNQQIPL